VRWYGDAKNVEAERECTKTETDMPSTNQIIIIKLALLHAFEGEHQVVQPLVADDLVPGVLDPEIDLVPHVGAVVRDAEVR